MIFDTARRGSASRCNWDYVWFLLLIYLQDAAENYVIPDLLSYRIIDIILFSADISISFTSTDPLVSLFLVSGKFQCSFRSERSAFPAGCRAQ